MKTPPRPFAHALVAGATAALMLAGCAAPAYRLPGTESLPLSSLATVRSGPRAAAYFTSVDGNRVARGFPPVVRWELSPGEHSVVVALGTMQGGRADNIPLKFVALPGRAYVIEYAVSTVMGRGTWRAWIEDETGTTVSTPDTDHSSSAKVEPTTS